MKQTSESISLVNYIDFGRMHALDLNIPTHSNIIFNRKNGKTSKWSWTLWESTFMNTDCSPYQWTLKNYLRKREPFIREYIRVFTNHENNFRFNSIRVLLIRQILSNHLLLYHHSCEHDYDLQKLLSILEIDLADIYCPCTTIDERYKWRKKNKLHEKRVSNPVAITF